MKLKIRNIEINPALKFIYLNLKWYAFSQCVELLDAFNNHFESQPSSSTSATTATKPLDSTTSPKPADFTTATKPANVTTATKPADVPKPTNPPTGYSSSTPKQPFILYLAFPLAVNSKNS